MNKKDIINLIFIFILTVTITGICFKFIPPFPVTGDAIDYDLIAQNLVKGKGYSIEEGIPSSRRPPGYPFFLALIYGIFGHNYWTVRILQFFLLAGIGIIIYLMARKTFKLSFNFSFLASLITVAWPYFILYSTLILTEILFTFLLLLSIFFLIKFWKEKTNKSCIMSGVLLGMAMLVRPVVLLLPIWIFIFFFIFKKIIKMSFGWKKMIIFLSVVLIIISPWILRNFFQFNRLIPIASAGGDSILHNQILGRAFIHFDYIPGVYFEPDEVTLKTILTFKLKNIYLFWNPGAGGERTQTLLENYPWMNMLFLIYKIAFYIILGMAFLSLKFIKQKEIFLLWIVIFYFWALHTILYPYPRYTLPIIPLIILLAFFSLNSFWRSLSKQKPKSALEDCGHKF